MNVHPKIAVSLLMLSTLMSACSSSSSDSSGRTCSPVSDISGEPDILSAPSFTSSTVTAGSTVQLQIPIDADTAYVSALLVAADRSGTAGGKNLTISTPGAQTVTLNITTGFTTTPDNYFPEINVCTDANSCASLPGSTGIAVSYTTDSMTSPGPNYTRTKFYDNGSVTNYSVVCMTVPYVTIQ